MLACKLLTADIFIITTVSNREIERGYFQKKIFYSSCRFDRVWSRFLSKCSDINIIFIARYFSVSICWTELVLMASLLFVEAILFG